MSQQDLGAIHAGCSCANQASPTKSSAQEVALRLRRGISQNLKATENEKIGVFHRMTPQDDSTG